KVTNAILLFQYRQHALAIRGVVIESEINGTFSDELIPFIAGQRDEAVVSLKNGPVGEPGNDERVRTRAERFRETLLAFTQRFLGPLAFGNVADDREPTMLATKFERLGRERDPTRFARFPLHCIFKVTNVISLFQNRQHALSIRGVDIESEIDRAFTNHFIPGVAGQGGKAVVSLKNAPVREPGTHQTPPACPASLSQHLP